MIILFTLFLIQFSIACSCLAVSSSQQQQFAEEGWNRVSNKVRLEVQNTFYCCGFNSTSTDHPSCDSVQVWKCTFWCQERLFMHMLFPQPLCCPANSPSDCSCSPCLQKLEDVIDYAFKLCGGIGLFFSFTEVRNAIFVSSVYCESLAF